MKTYKFYNQTTKKTINIFDSVSLSFDYSNNHKDNVYLGFNLYTSRFDDPIILNVIENINSNITNEYGTGSSFYLDYSVTISSDEQYITLTYPHGETEFFIKEGDSNKYISEYKTHYIDKSDNKIEIKLDNVTIISDSLSFSS